MSEQARRVWATSAARVVSCSCAQALAHVRRRPELDAGVDYLRAGDTLSCGGSIASAAAFRHLVELVAEPQGREIAFRSLTEAIDTATPAGRLQLHLFAALAEFERELIRERSQPGRETARARGRMGGRPPLMTAEKVAAAVAMRAHGDLTMAQIAAALGAGRSTLYQHLDLHDRGQAGDELAA